MKVIFDNLTAFVVYMYSVSQSERILLMKIAILGFSGSGKSTLAKQLSAFYNIPLLYLDCVNFKENWVVRNKDEQRAMVAEFMKNESWVIDGNYNSLYQKERLFEADLIIILYYNRFACMKGAFKRNIEYKNKVRESISDGCCERMNFEFFLWLLYRQYSFKRKNHFKGIKSLYPKKTLLLKSRKKLNIFLGSIMKGDIINA